MQQAAKLFKVLSEVSRLRILGLLQYGELCVCDLMEVLDMPQSTVSRHLAKLKERGLVQDRRSTVWSYYRLAAPGNELASTVLQALGHELGQTEQFQYDRQRLQDFWARREDGHCA